MTREGDNLPKPKFKEDQYIKDGEGQEFNIDFIEYDFEREEYYYYPMPDTYAGKIYESDAKLTEGPKTPAEETYEILFGNRSK